MSDPIPSILQLVLSNEALGGRVTVPLEAFLDYDEAMNVALEELEEKWTPFAAPASLASFNQSNPWNR